MANAPRPVEFAAASLTSFAEAGGLVEQFERILRSNGIQIATGSDLESVCLDVMELDHFRQKRSVLDPMTDIRPLLGQATGWVEFLKMLVRGEQDGRLDQFIPHLRLLNTAREVTQNTRLPVSDEASNKLFELFVALACGPISSDLILDDPRNARGTNPDILATIEGIRWGFACKVLNGSSPLTMFERLEEGLDQIERSPAQTGFVFLNFKNLVDHRRAWPITNEGEFLQRKAEPLFGAWQDERPVIRQFGELLNGKWDDLIEMNGARSMHELFAGKRAMPGAAVYMATASAIRGSTGPLASMIGQIGILRVTEIPPQGERVLELINDVLHGRR